MPLILSHAVGCRKTSECCLLKGLFCKSNPELILCLSHRQVMWKCISARHMIENLQENRKCMIELYVTINLKVSRSNKLKECQMKMVDI